MAPRRKCLICGSRQWRKNAMGLVTCSEGHVLQHYINESEEADDVGPHMMRKRTLKAGQKKKERASRADPKLYHGDRAHFHYYQCLQLLFRKQVAALMTLWNLPPEFEAICRDLWVLHLNLIPNPPPAEPFHYTREQEGYQCEPEGNEKGGGDRSGPEDGKENAAPEPDENSTSSEDDMFVPDITVLLEENSEVSSSEDESGGDEARATTNMQTSSQNMFLSCADRPVNTIAVLVLACWTFRLPVVYMDLIRAIERYSVPYLDHVHTLPSSLTRHLTSHAVQALSPHHAPKTLSLHRLAFRLANQLYDSFDIVIPALNAAPVLWRVVQECYCGTPMLYGLTKRVRTMLSLGLAVQGSSSAALSDIDGQIHENPPPEVSLAASAIVVLKLVYGLDGKPRQPRDSGEAAWAFPTVTDFLAAVKEADHAESRSSTRLSSLSVADLDDSALDEYIDFCQRVLLHLSTDGDQHRVIGNYFPLASATADPVQGKHRRLGERGLPAPRESDEIGILAPGEMYTIYDAKDVLGNLPGDLQIVVDRCARWAGIRCDYLCGVVERYERRLLRWWQDKRRERGEQAGH